jgi:NAD-dependent DNA ligase
MHVTPELLQDLQKNPYVILEAMSVKEIASLIKIANQAYHNDGKPLFSDAIYDLVLEYFAKLVPDHPLLSQSYIGALPTKNKVDLPTFMASLDKLKEQEDIARWLEKFKGAYVVSDKLDGISCLYHQSKLYSRGNGNQGQDISHLLKYITLPNIDTDMMVRGELIISKTDFEKHIKDKRTNARNTVAGLANSKSVDPEIAKYVKFIAYECIHPRMKPSEATILLEKLKFNVVYYKPLASLDANVLSTILNNRREKSAYEIDGIVVVHDDIHEIAKDSNPTYAFAYKNILTNTQAEVTIKRVIWQVTKNAFLKPVV